MRLKASSCLNSVGVSLAGIVSGLLGYDIAYAYCYKSLVCLALKSIKTN